MAGKPRIAESEWDSICTRYKQREDVGVIALQYDVGREAIYRILRKRGIPVEKRGGAPPVPEAIKLQICSLYQEKRGATSIARMFGIDKKSVYNILARAGIGTRPRHDRTGDEYHFSAGQEKWFMRERRGHLRGPKGNFNYDAFSVLDEVACYWAGYLITDGCIGSYDGRSYRLYLPQSRKHEEQCEKLKAYLGSELQVQQYEKETFGKVRDFSLWEATLPDEVAQRLLKLGIRPAKTAVVKAPDVLIDRAAFWRGVIDGDGSVWATQIGMNSSSPKLAAQFRRFVRSLLPDAPIGLYRNQAGVWMLRIYTKEHAPILARLLYPSDVCCGVTDKKERAWILSVWGKERTPGKAEGSLSP